MRNLTFCFQICYYASPQKYCNNSNVLKMILTLVYPIVMWFKDTILLICRNFYRCTFVVLYFCSILPIVPLTNYSFDLLYFWRIFPFCPYELSLILPFVFLTIIWFTVNSIFTVMKIRVYDFLYLYKSLHRCYIKN